MRHKSNNKTRPLFTLSLEMTRLVNETRLLLVPCLIGIYIMVLVLNLSTSKFCCCRYVKLPPGSMGVYDPTEIRNRGLLARFQKEAFVKIAFHLITFFVALYG